MIIGQPFDVINRLGQYDVMYCRRRRPSARPVLSATA